MVMFTTHDIKRIALRTIQGFNLTGLTFKRVEVPYWQDTEENTLVLKLSIAIDDGGTNSQELNGISLIFDKHTSEKSIRNKIINRIICELKCLIEHTNEIMENQQEYEDNRSCNLGQLLINSELIVERLRFLLK